MERRYLLAVSIALAMFILLACTAEPTTVEVTREVPVPQQIPVTVAVPQTVIVTRESPVTREIPVTVESVQTVEVTREVETVKTVEVTREVEVPVTRIVQATINPTMTVTAPAPTLTPTLTTPATATPSPVLATTPPPTAEPRQFGNWLQTPEVKNYADRTIMNFQTSAVQWETVPKPPLITYQCDNRGGRTMFIEWYLPLSNEDSNWPRDTAASEFLRYNSDPFQEYRDDDLDALVDTADQLLQFTNEAQIHRSDQHDLGEIWDNLRKRWNLDQDAITELVNRMQERNHRVVRINLDFYLENTNADRSSPHRAPVLSEIDGLWVALPGHRTYMSQSAIGELRRAYRDFGRLSETNELAMMAALVVRPDQVAPIMASWQIEGLDAVMTYCRTIRRLG